MSYYIKFFMMVFAQLFCSSDIWPSDHVRNGNISSYCGANDSLVFGLNSIYNTSRKIHSRSLLTNIFNLTSNSSTKAAQITTPHANIVNPTSSHSSCEPTHTTSPQSPTLTTNGGPTTPPDQSCDVKCLEEIETDVIRGVSNIYYVNNKKLLFFLFIGEGIRNFEQNITIPGI